MNRLATITAMLAMALALCESVAADDASTDVEVNDFSSDVAPRAVPLHPSAAALEDLGRKLFFDRQLSASHRQSCASCHDGNC